MQVSTIRPGLLISLKSSIKGNVVYEKRDIEADHNTAIGTRRAVWETERTITDPVEHEDAIKARGKARTLITKLCAPSNFGLLCRKDKREELDAAIAEARKVADDFNARAELTTVSVHVMVGEVSSNDVEAVRAINSEVRDLLATMERGIKTLDPKVIKDAATEARKLSQMLSPSASEQVERAIEQARNAARQIAKDGEISAVVVGAQLRIIKRSAEVFLDLDDAPEVARPIETAGRAVDFMTPDTAELDAPFVRSVQREDDGPDLDLSPMEMSAVARPAVAAQIDL